jgi:hypothetical protein
MNCLKKLSKLLAAALFCCALLATEAFAQQITATLTGEIKDPSGAVVPGATVTATSIETGLAKTAVTNDDGRYTIAFLQPGAYNITVEKAGFARVERQNIKLETGQTAGVNIDLAVTAGEVSVDVESGEVPLLQTESSALDTTIENKLVEDLPSGERSALAFINLVPGAIDAGFAQGRGEGLNENGNAQGPIGSPGNRNFFDSNFSVNGGRSSTNDVLLDGVSNTVGDFNGVAVSPPQDSIREFKVIAGSYPAEYGRSGGGVVSITTKSGGRRYSGALYEYYQDGDLNANGWQRNRRGLRANGQEVLPRIDILRHQYGGALGGPLPFFNFGEGTPGGIFRKLEKTFFFFNYEGRFEKNPFSKEITLPTARMRTGDLSEIPVQIFNPYIAGRNTAFANNNLSTLPICSNAPGQRQAACLDPVALEVLKYIPLPNQPGTTLNYIFDGKATFRRDIYAFRLDHTFSERHSLFTRFSYEKRFTSEPNYFEGSVAANVRKVKDTFYNFTFNDTYALSATLINNFRYGYTRVRANQIPESLGFDPTLLGLPADFRNRAAELKFPEFIIGGTSNTPGDVTSGNIGGAGNNQPRDTHTAANAMTYISGNQTLRFGGEYRLLRFYPFQFFTPTGSFTFNRNWTANSSGNGGAALASFLLGLPASGNQETIIPLTLYHHYGAAFIQDDWRVTNRLVLNLGLRWDFETGTGEANGAMTNFDLLAASPLQGRQQNLASLDRFVAALNPNVANNVGLLNFVDGPQTKTNYDRFAPRVGFAFRINDKTTLRGGYGMFYVPTSIENPAAQGTNFTTAISQAANQTTTLASAATAVYLTNPFPNGIPAPPGTSLGSRTRLGQQVFAVEPERENPYNQQWNLVLQRELVKNTVLDIAYVGSKAVHLPIQSVELNEIPASTLEYARNNFNQPGTCPTAQNPNNACANVAAFFTQQVANPFNQYFVQNPVPGASAAVTGATVQRLQLLRAFPQYSSVQLFRPHWGSSDYHALQINLQRRFTNGLSATVNYTWSKLLDTGGVGNGAAFLDATAIQDASNFAREYSYSTLDVPHRFVASWSYELPFGRKKKFGGDWNGFAQFFFGGWQTSGSFTWQRGTPIPITVTNAFPNSVAISSAVRRPDRVAGKNFDLGTSRDNAAAQGLWFNPALFVDPIYEVSTNNFVFGNAARTHNDIRRDNYRNINLSLLKNWFWAEGRQKLQFRAEFLNAFNWVVYGTPVSTLNVTGAVGTANNNTLDSRNPCFATQQCFGQVRTQGNTPRNIQFVLRYTF